MRHSFWFLLLYLIMAQAAARSVEICPALPENSGLSWTYDEGPDFDVCIASSVESGDRAFGIYLGNHASFDTKGARRVGKSTVAGRSATWYGPSLGGSSPFSRETLLMLDKSGYVAHIWVYADTQQQLLERLVVLEHITFQS
jgi:hypothetical protein